MTHQASIVQPDDSDEGDEEGGIEEEMQDTLMELEMELFGDMPDEENEPEGQPWHDKGKPRSTIGQTTLDMNENEPTKGTRPEPTPSVSASASAEPRRTERGSAADARMILRFRKTNYEKPGKPAARWYSHKKKVR